MKYLLDTNIVAFFFRKHLQVGTKMKAIGSAELAISEITLAELKYGAARSLRPDYQNALLDKLVSEIAVLTVSNAIDYYAQEKARLVKNGTRIEDFDILIGASAVVNNLILVTNNGKHMSRLNGIQLEDWTTESSV